MSSPQHKHLDKTTEHVILESAREIFHKKGLEGARMQEIADHAGINKAMLHYYYKNKEKLFAAVFEEAAQRIFPKVKELLNVELPLFEKIEYFVEKYMTILLDNIYMPAFVINEINKNPKRISKIINKKAGMSPNVFMSQINEAINKGIIVPIDPRQLLINIISMCIFPILWKPLITELYGLSEKEFTKFLTVRKKQIPSFIINAIKIKK